MHHAARRSWLKTALGLYRQVLLIETTRLGAGLWTLPSLDFTDSDLSGGDRRAGGVEVNTALGDLDTSVTVDR